MVDGVLDKAEVPTQPGPVVHGLVVGRGRDGDAVRGVGLSSVHFFPTGQGNVIGNPILPVIKLCANPRTVRTMAEHIDVDVSALLRNEMSPDGAGDKLLECMFAHGQRTLDRGRGPRPSRVRADAPVRKRVAGHLRATEEHHPHRSSSSNPPTGHSRTAVTKTGVRGRQPQEMNMKPITLLAAAAVAAITTVTALPAARRGQRAQGRAPIRHQLPADDADGGPEADREGRDGGGRAQPAGRRGRSSPAAT